MKKQIIAWAVLTAIFATWAYTYASENSTGTLVKDEIMQIVKKARSWETLTADEQTKLNSIKSKRNSKTSSGELNEDRGFDHDKWWMWKMMWEWMWFGPMIQLTDAEKTSLKSMSDTEKKAFFDKKRLEAEAKKDARKTVIDKLLAGTALSSDEETVRAEIIKERAEMKAKKAEFDAIKTLLEKKKNWETLTADEEAKITAFEANKPKHSEKGGMMWGRWMNR